METEKERKGETRKDGERQRKGETRKDGERQRKRERGKMERDRDIERNR